MPFIYVSGISDHACFPDLSTYAPLSSAQRVAASPQATPRVTGEGTPSSPPSSARRVIASPQAAPRDGRGDAIVSPSASFFSKDTEASGDTGSSVSGTRPFSSLLSTSEDNREV